MGGFRPLSASSAIDLSYCSIVWLFSFGLSSPSGWYLEVSKAYVQCVKGPKNGIRIPYHNQSEWLRHLAWKRPVEWRVVQLRWCDGIVSWNEESDCLRDDQQWLDSRCKPEDGGSFSMKSMDMDFQGFLGSKLLEKSIGFVVHRSGMGTSGAWFAVVLDVDGSLDNVLACRLDKGLRLTKMTCKGMVMWVLRTCSWRLPELNIDCVKVA